MSGHFFSTAGCAALSIVSQNLVLPWLRHTILSHRLIVCPRSWDPLAFPRSPGRSLYPLLPHLQSCCHRYVESFVPARADTFSFHFESIIPHWEEGRSPLKIFWNSSPRLISVSWPFGQKILIKNRWPWGTVLLAKHRLPPSDCSYLSFACSLLCHSFLIRISVSQRQGASASVSFGAFHSISRVTIYVLIVLSCHSGPWDPGAKRPSLQCLQLCRCSPFRLPNQVIVSVDFHPVTAENMLQHSSYCVGQGSVHCVSAANSKWDSHFHKIFSI